MRNPNDPLEAQRLPHQHSGEYRIREDGLGELFQNNAIVAAALHCHLSHQCTYTEALVLMVKHLTGENDRLMDQLKAYLVRRAEPRVITKVPFTKKWKKN